MSSIPSSDDVLASDEPSYDLATVAELLGVPVTRVHQQLRDGQLLAVRQDRGLVIPKIFFTEAGEVVRSLPGLLALLRDGGYTDTEIVRWLFTPDATLATTRDGAAEPVPNARPIDALHAHQAREVMRRAQAMAY